MIPLNTHGGQLSHGRTHGMGLIHEAVTQLRGEAGERQVADAKRRRRQQRRPDPQRRDPDADGRVRADATGQDVAAGAAPRPRVVLVDGVPMSGTGRRGAGPAGGSRGFPRRGEHRSVFRLSRDIRVVAAAHGRGLGYTVVALDRPGTARRRHTRTAMERPEQRVALAYGAVDKILGRSSRGAGLFLFAHSAGCELAVRMAVDERAAPT